MNTNLLYESLQSSNGTYINGEILSEPFGKYPLYPDDIIGIGSTEFNPNERNDSFLFQVIDVSPY